MTRETLGGVDLPDDIAAGLVMSANNGLTNRTWRQYNVVLSHVDECARVTGMSKEFPFDRSQVLTLVGYLLTRKKLKSSTISSYLSALRMQHVVRGHLDAVMRSPLIDLILQGKANWDEVQARAIPQRLPMTLVKMELLKAVLDLDKTTDAVTKATLMAIACICFWGSFRLGRDGQ